MNTAVAQGAPSPLANDLSSIRAANTTFLAQPRKLLIDGSWVSALSGKTFEVRDPSSDRIIGHCAEGDASDVNRAVEAARRAFEEGDWSRMNAVDRERLLHRLADLIEAQADELAELEAIDNGKSIVMARHVDIKHALEVWRYMAGWPTKLEGKTLPLSGTLMPGQQYTAFLARADRRGGGNHRLEFPVLARHLEVRTGTRRRLHGRLEAGGATPLTALRLGELALEAGFPKGVLNVVTGMGPTAGAALKRPPRRR